MLNTVFCKYCGNCIDGGCANIKRVTNTLAIDIKSRKCKGCHKNIHDQKEKWHDDVEIVEKN